jgi:hypothetical protein
MEKEYEGRGLCPYDPDHNSTAVYSGKYMEVIDPFHHGQQSSFDLSLYRQM